MRLVLKFYFISVLVLFVAFNAASANTSIEDILRNPNISKEQKKEAFFRNAIEQNPQMEIMLKNPNVKKQFESQFDSVLELISAHSAMQKEHEQQEQQQRLSEQKAKDEADAKRKAYEEEIVLRKAYSSNEKSTFQSPFNTQKVAITQDYDFAPIKLSDDQVAYWTGSGADTIAVSTITHGFGLTLDTLSHLDRYCQSISSSNTKNWRISDRKSLGFASKKGLRKEDLPQKISFNDSQAFLDTKAKLVIKDINANGSERYNYFSANKSSRTLSKYNVGQSLYYPLCIADIDREYSESPPFPIAHLEKLEFGDVYLGMTIGLDDNGTVPATFKKDWDYSNKRPSAIHYELPELSDELLIRQCQSVIEGDPRFSSLLVGRGKFKRSKKVRYILDQRAADWISKLHGLKRLRFGSADYDYYLLLNRENKVIYIDATRSFKRDNVTSSQLVKSVIQKYGQPLLKREERDENTLMFYIRNDFPKLPDDKGAKPYPRNDRLFYRDLLLGYRIFNSIHFEVYDEDRFVVGVLPNLGLQRIDGREFQTSGIRMVAYRWNDIWEPIESARSFCKDNIEGKLQELNEADSNSLIEL